MVVKITPLREFRYMSENKLFQKLKMSLSDLQNILFIMRIVVVFFSVFLEGIYVSLIGKCSLRWQ